MGTRLAFHPYRLSNFRIWKLGSTGMKKRKQQDLIARESEVHSLTSSPRPKRKKKD